ncbi:MAG: radical SAM protein [Spirochaetes bacterium]|jgi:DNA repair photolyase|nr:radical SAM protein [Spirochaetota bacterium]
MIIKEKYVKTILSESRIYNYALNPYTGCQFGCSYCYARYMKKFTGHNEPWGEFVDVKVNAVELLMKEINKKKKDRVWISGVCDPYQPLEAKHGLTGGCLEILADNGWPIVIQTKSPLVLRDIDVFKHADNCDVGFSIGSADDGIRRLFEPEAPPVTDRVNALKELHDAGIRTYAMIAPVLPGAEKLMELLDDRVDYIYLDRMNYSHADSVYKKNKLEYFLTDEYFESVSREISGKCRKAGIECRIVF